MGRNRQSWASFTALAVGATAALCAQAQTFKEVKVTPQIVGDIEFDWGRDGISCPTCNFGDGNARFNWTDSHNDLWIAHMDPATGLMPNKVGDDELVDTNAAFWDTYGNGPEWAFSTQNGQVVSQLVYTRFAVGEPHKDAYAGAAFATQIEAGSATVGTWTASFLPGAIGAGNFTPGSNSSNLPEASQCNTDPVALAMYKNFVTTPYIQMFTEPVTTQSGTTRTMTPIMTSNGIGERFVPCTHQLLFQGQKVKGDSYQQVYWYDLDTQVVQQLTADATSKNAGFMFKAPDFGDNYIFFTLANRLTINVYEQTGTYANGAPKFTLVNQIASPDPAEPYMNSPEPFINCTPTCTTYVFSTLAATSDAQTTQTEPIGLAVFALNKATPVAKVLAAAQATPTVQRVDPEYYITAKGPYLYYNRATVRSGATPYTDTGLFYIDMQLGAPSGACVGSSAQDGLLPGC